MRILHATNAKIVQILRCPLHCGMGLPAMLIKNVKCFQQGRILLKFAVVGAHMTEMKSFV